MYWLMSIGGSHLQYLRLHVATSLAAALDGGSTYHDGEGVPAPTLPLYDTQEADGANEGNIAAICASHKSTVVAACNRVRVL